MTIAVIPGLGRFELDWGTTQNNPWHFEITTVWWLGDNKAHDKWTGIKVNTHAQCHRMQDGRCLHDWLHDWILDNENPDEDEYYYDDDRDFSDPYEP